MLKLVENLQCHKISVNIVQTRDNIKHFWAACKNLQPTVWNLNQFWVYIKIFNYSELWIKFLKLYNQWKREEKSNKDETNAHIETMRRCGVERIEENEDKLKQRQLGMVVDGIIMIIIIISYRTYILQREKDIGMK